jgi:16S rRNA (adenine1518-N6/adenine1519-N6)-dimethyltransferase
VTAFSSLPPHSAKPRKSLGQYFLADNRILNRIVAAADLEFNDLVVEVGPGRGALTRRLLPKVDRVISVELDEHLAESLPTRLGNPPNLAVVQADARTVDLSRLIGNSTTYKVVANLPYYAANPIVRRFLECDCPPTTMVMMVQREVAESMTAAPGGMTLLSVATQFYASARLVCLVPPSAFRPAPKVSSAVIRLDLLDAPAVKVSSPGSFFHLVRAGFSAPRKQLRNSLSHGLGVEPVSVTGMLEEARVDGVRRAETLGLEEWEAVYSAWKNFDQPSFTTGEKFAS